MLHKQPKVVFTHVVIFWLPDMLSEGLVGRTTQKQLQTTVAPHCEQSLYHITSCSQYYIWASKTSSPFRLSYSLSFLAPKNGKQHPSSVYHIIWRRNKAGSVQIHQWHQLRKKKKSGNDSCSSQSRVWLAPSNKERGCIFTSGGKTKYWTAAH